MNEEISKDEVTKTPEKSKSKRNKIIVAVVGVVVTCCCLVFVIPAANDSAEDDEAVATVEVLEEEVTSEETAVDEVEEVAKVEPTSIPSPASTPEPTNTAVPTDTPAPTNTPVPTATPNPNLVKAGTYIVGTDIQSGLYRGEAGTGFFDSCYWERLSDLTGEFDAILANDNSNGQFYIEVREGDYALQTDCELVLLDPLPEPLGEFPDEIALGSYLVGIDIQPGIYRGLAGIDFMDSCYWERLSSASGGFDGILANEGSNGQFYIEVDDSDFILKTACDLALLNSLPESSGEFPTEIEPGTYIVGRDIQAGT